MPSPLFDQHLCLLQRVEDLAIEKLVPELLRDAQTTAHLTRLLSLRKQNLRFPQHPNDLFRCVSLASGQTVPEVCRVLGITEQTYYRWRKEYGGLKVEQARRFS